MNKPVINRRLFGEFSTVLLPDGIVETMWFGDDGSQVFVARSRALREIAAQHIREFESKQAGT